MATTEMNCLASGGGTLNPITKVWGEGTLPTGTLTVNNLPFEPQSIIEFRGTSSNTTFKYYVQALYDVVSGTFVYQHTSNPYSNVQINGKSFSVDITTQASTNSAEIYIS